MKASELRIGNWLNINGGPAPILGGWFTLIASHRENLLPPHEPISLTPEILEKCGYIKTDNQYKNSKSECYVDYDTMFISEFNGKFEFTILSTDTNGYDVPLTSLHQLQNLYFALTGEELQINL
jgi:hypothetical protein